jgi:glycosyltransferase involved in cell wall biosynthesis
VAAATGFVPPAQVGGYLERASVVVCPSRREGYGVVARQAMAYGRPVVATAVGGLPDAVVDGETGLLVPARDVAALRAALERLLGDPELRARLGRAARQRAHERFGLEAAAAATIAAYRDALERASE